MVTCKEVMVIVIPSAAVLPGAAVFMVAIPIVALLPGAAVLMVAISIVACVTPCNCVDGCISQ